MMRSFRRIIFTELHLRWQDVTRWIFLAHDGYAATLNFGSLSHVSIVFAFFHFCSVQLADKLFSSIFQPGHTTPCHPARRQNMGIFEVTNGFLQKLTGSPRTGDFLETICETFCKGRAAQNRF
jgi:hypothetical protein